MAEDREIAITAVLKGNLTNELGKIGRNATDARSGLEKITNNGFVRQVTGALSAVTAGWVGLSAAQKAWSEAEYADKAGQALKSALGFNQDLLETLDKQADKMQRISTVTNDEVTNLQASLLNRGVTLRDITKATEAAVNLAAGLNMSLDEAGNALAVTYSGVLPRSLARAVPALRALTEEQLRSGDAVDLVEKRFAGFAQKLAETDFGRHKQQVNQLNDQYEELGRQLVKVANIVLPPINRGLGNAVGASQAIEEQGWRRYAGNALVQMPGSSYIMGKSLRALNWLDRRSAGVTGRAAGLVDPQLLEDQGPEAMRMLANALGLSTDEDFRRQQMAAMNADKPTDIELRRQLLARQAGRQGLASEATSDLLAQLATMQGGYVEGQNPETRRGRVNARLDRRYGAGLMGLQSYLGSRFGSGEQALQGSIDQVRQTMQSAQARFDRLNNSPDIPTGLDDKGEPTGFMKDYVQMNAALRELVPLQEQLNRLLQKQEDLRDQRSTIAATEAVKYAKGSLDDYNQSLARNADLVRSGSITFLEAQRRNTEAQAQFVDKSLEAVAVLKELYAQQTSDEGRRAIQQQIEAIDSQVELVTNRFKQLAGEIRDSLQTPTEGFFQSIIMGTQSAGQAFKTMVAGWAASLASLAANKLTNKLLDGALGVVLSGAGSYFGGMFRAGPTTMTAADQSLSANHMSGGEVPFDTSTLAQFNSGGVIPGRGPDYDSVIIRATPGEGVIRRRAMSRLGSGALARINRDPAAAATVGRMLGGASVSVGSGRVNYNTGGTVEPGSMSGSERPAVVTAVVPPDDATMSRLLRGGRRAFIEAAAENRDDLRSALGI
jgi:hypothetical protein